MDRWWEMTIDSGKLDWIWDGTLDDRGYDDTDKQILARIVSRPCPTCNAEPGQWCRTAGGHVLDHLDKAHVTRRAVGSYRHLYINDEHQDGTGCSIDYGVSGST
jgi:hypothetical protein